MERTTSETCGPPLLRLNLDTILKSKLLLNIYGTKHSHEDRYLPVNDSNAFGFHKVVILILCLVLLG